MPNDGMTDTSFAPFASAHEPVRAGSRKAARSAVAVDLSDCRPTGVIQMEAFEFAGIFERTRLT